MARESRRRREERRFGKAQRLADLVLTGCWRVPYFWDRRKIGDEQCEEIRRSVVDAVAASRVVVADNVAEYLFAQMSKEIWDTQRDFPQCVPPFPEMFLEFSRPSCINSEGQIRSSLIIPPMTGWLVSCSGRDELLASMRDGDGVRVAREEMNHQIQTLGEMISPALIDAAISDAARTGDALAAIDALPFRERTYLQLHMAQRLLDREAGGPPQLPEAMAWGVRATCLIGYGDAVSLLGEVRFPIGRTGEILGKPMYYIHACNSPEIGDQMTDVLSSLAHPLFLAMSFMNCKNVTLQANEPDAALNRERKKAGKKPFLRYHTIDIEPMKTVLRAEGMVDEVGLKKALHICRGHFATYTEDRPLFGRVVGTVWRPSHTRGSFKSGVVVSDYAVHAPATTRG